MVAGRRLTASTLLIGLFGVSGCFGQSEAVRAALARGMDVDRTVDLGNAAVTVEQEGPRVMVRLLSAGADGEWQVSQVGSGEAAAGTNTYFIVTGSGLGLSWNTFVYGTASPGVERVSVAGLSGARGGTVVDGVWVVASPNESAGPGSLRIEFLDSAGAVVGSWRGLLDT